MEIDIKKIEADRKESHFSSVFYLWDEPTDNLRFIKPQVYSLGQRFDIFPLNNDPNIAEYTIDLMFQKAPAHNFSATHIIRIAKGNKAHYYVLRDVGKIREGIQIHGRKI